MKKVQKLSKKHQNAIFKGLLLFAALIILRFANNANFSFALCFGLYVASLFCGIGLLPASIAYGLSCAFFGQLLFFYGAVSLAVTVAIVLLLKALHKNVSRLWFFAILFLGQIFFLAFDTNTAQILIEKAIYFCVTFVFALVSFYTIKSVFVRGLKYKLNTDEKICISVFIICLSLGLSNINPFDVPLLRLFGGFALLAGLYIFGNFTCLMSAILMGSGSAFGTGTLTDVAIFAMWGVVAVSFKQIKPLAVLSVPLMDFVVKYFFQGHLISIQASAALIVGCLAFLCVPNSVLSKWNDKMGRNGEHYAVRSIVNRTKNNLSRKLYDLSEIFFEMKLSFLGMVKGVLPREQAKVMLAREVSEEVCHDCPERTVCWRTNMEKTEKAFLSMMEGALDRGKATVLDLPNAMTQKCKRLNSVLSGVNQSVERYKNYYAVATNNDNSRLLIGEQLAGVSSIMKNLSELSKVQSAFDREKERALFEELTRVGVLVKEAVVTSENANLFVTIVVEAGDYKKPCVGETVSRVCGVSMMLTETQTTQSKNWVVLTYVVAPKFDVIFGFAAVKKNGSEVSGDTHTFLRIDEHKFLLGLCDGMGSGVNAEKASSTSISLIENFYKAGFDNETILTSVNKLLSLSQDEVFTAVDVCVMDLQEGICDFIKIGATYGFVKSKNSVEIISAGSLPLGVLEEMKPCITKKALSDGDTVVVVSDGITDAFATKEELATKIAQIALKTPQETADVLLAAALEKDGNEAKDDMTVVVAQIFEK